MAQRTDPAALAEVQEKVEKAYNAWLLYREFSQEKIDSIVEAIAAEGRRHARRLAEMAVEETTYGNVEDKTGKNLLCAEWLPKRIRGMKTVGVLRELPEEGIVEYGVPVGVVAAITPCTNPTSTVIYKSIISLKAGNAVVISPHPSARRCTFETAELLHRAAVAAGAPEGIIQCLSQPTLESTQALMRHERTAVILATGGTGMVRAAYSSGKPAFGVGPGNVPVLVDTSADVSRAVAMIVEGKRFDYGTVCSSEQNLIAECSLREAILAALKANRAYICNDQEREQIARTLISPAGTINPKCVGQSPVRLAEMAGFQVPPDTSILVVELDGVGRGYPLSMEKLSPVLALFFVPDFESALQACQRVLEYNGLGHTCTIHSRDESRIREFARRMPAMRVLVNTQSPQGSVGITTNLLPSMTLGCGAIGGNSTGDNVGPLHLINIKRLAYWVRRPEEAFRVPPAGAEEALPERELIIAAVERYLAERGIRLQPPPQPARPISETAAEIVDRFLASRPRTPATPPTLVPPPPPQPPQAPEPASPNVQIVDFVCENDVREAIRAGRKIFIGRKTIVTPAARELADQFDILVVAER